MQLDDKGWQNPWVSVLGHPFPIFPFLMYLQTGRMGKNCERSWYFLILSLLACLLDDSTEAVKYLYYCNTIESIKSLGGKVQYEKVALASVTSQEEE